MEGTDRCDYADSRSVFLEVKFLIGNVGVLTPRSPETPTLSGDTIGRQQADIYPYMDEPQTRQDDHPDRH